MVKSNTPSRDMRALQRNVFKMKNELDRTKQKSASFKKMVYVQRDRVICVFRSMHEQKKTLEQENQILLTSLKNFNKTCNEQKKTIHKQEQQLLMLHKVSKELHLLKRGLLSIQSKQNPCLSRKANI